MSDNAILCLGTKSLKEQVRCIQQNDSKIFTEYPSNVCWKDISDDKVLIFIRNDVIKGLSDPKSLDVNRYHVVDRSLIRDTYLQCWATSGTEEDVILKDDEFLSAVKTMFPEQYIKEQSPNQKITKVLPQGMIKENTNESNPNSAAMCIFILFIFIIIFIMWYRNAL